MKQTYSEKLKDPRWQKKRLEIFNRDEFKCVLCKDTETTLHVHHKSYEWNKAPWDYENQNYQTLCEQCHSAVEGLKSVPVLTPLRSFKVKYGDHNLIHLYMLTHNIETEIEIIQLFISQDGEFKYVTGMLRGEIDDLIKFVDADRRK